MKMLAAPTTRRIMSRTVRRFGVEIPARRSGISPTRRGRQSVTRSLVAESEPSAGSAVEAPGRAAPSVASAAMRMTLAVPAHPARRPGRRRGRQPPSARPGRVHPPGLGRASTPGCRSGTGCCARSSRSSARRWTRPAPRRCCSRSPSRSSCGSAAAATRPTAPLMFRLARPQGDRLLPLADGGGGGHHASSPRSTARTATCP